MGGGLTPWMESALETLSGDAVVTTLLEVDETILLGFLEGVCRNSWRDFLDRSFEVACAQDA